MLRIAKGLLIYGAALALLGLAGSAAAQGYPARAAVKLASGLATIVTAPVELVAGPYVMAAEFDRMGAPDTAGLFIGVLVGAGAAVGHILVGVEDVLTFFVAPKGMERPFQWTILEGIGTP